MIPAALVAVCACVCVCSNTNSMYNNGAKSHPVHPGCSTGITEHTLYVSVRFNLTSQTTTISSITHRLESNLIFRRAPWLLFCFRLAQTGLQYIPSSFHLTSKKRIKKENHLLFPFALPQTSKKCQDRARGRAGALKLYR